MFAPGDEVVCVDARERKYPTRLLLHAHYTVSAVGNWFGHETVELVGYVPDPRSTGTIFADRFRPVKRETIEIFRQMAKSTKPLIEVD